MIRKQRQCLIFVETLIESRNTQTLSPHCFQFLSSQSFSRYSQTQVVSVCHWWTETQTETDDGLRVAALLLTYQSVIPCINRLIFRLLYCFCFSSLNKDGSWQPDTEKPWMMSSILILRPPRPGCCPCLSCTPCTGRRAATAPAPPSWCSTAVPGAAVSPTTGVSSKHIWQIIRVNNI